MRSGLRVRGQYDPLQPLIALRDLADARQRYLAAAIDYNRSQFRLYWAMGQPPLRALAKMPPQTLTTPVAPEAYRPPEEVPPAEERQAIAHAVLPMGGLVSIN